MLHNVDVYETFKSICVVDNVKQFAKVLQNVFNRDSKCNLGN